MAAGANTDMGGSRGRIPTTHWSLLEAVRGPLSPEQRAVLNLLIQRYWKPVYHYIRRKGHPNEQAKDLTQDFFRKWVEEELFGRADPRRGRFRAYLLSCLDRFLWNAHRDARARTRKPEKGIVSIDSLAGPDGRGLEPMDRETPETIFNRTWVLELLQRVQRALEQECQATGKEVHYDLIVRCMIDPVFRGSKAPPMRQLAEEYGLTEKEANNRLVTARRAYTRLLQEEIRTYAASEEEVTSEIQDLFRFAAEP